jgi:cyclomaltodextrinase
MDDFIFGSLATAELRLKHTRSLLEGVTHNHRRLPRDPSPAQPIQLEMTTGPAHTSERAWVYWTTDASDPSGNDGIATNGLAAPMQKTQSEWNTLIWGYIQHFSVVLPAQPAGTLLRYRLSITSPGQPEKFADEGRYNACWIADDPTPDWAQDAVLYHIFVDRFHPGKGKRWRQPKDLMGFYGGTLKGIIDQQDYLSSLGVNVLYLSPIYPSPSHHGYDTTDFLTVEPRLGSLDDFMNLASAAHSRQIRVILDFVPNHCSDQHPFFQDAIRNPGSPYRQWFSFKHYPDEYETFFGVRELPQLNLRYPPARQHILDAACHWLRLGADGFRLDYAIGPAPDFWAEFRRATRAVRPDCWTFGEVVDPPDSQLAFEGGLDGCLDFILMEALRQSLAFSRWDGCQLGEFLDRHEAFFPASFSRPCFLDNHDMNRFLWAVDNDVRRLKLAALCQFSLAGMPLIYYGTEVGLSQKRDVRQGGLGLPHEARQPMLWNKTQNKDLLEFYRRLIRLRRGSAALCRGTRQNLLATPEILAYLRVLGVEKLAIVLNLADHEQHVDLPGFWTQVVLATQSGYQLSTGAGVRLTLPALAGLILQ